MDAIELLKKVRRIEIKTKGLTREIFAGQYHSAFKGKGIVFSELREYVYGDDVRDINWKVTARFNRPYVKIYEEERELTVILMIDVSNSGSFGSFEIKKDYIAEIAAILAFSAIENNDKIGVILFSDKVEKFIPPRKGRKQILLTIREILAFKPKSTGTNISQALKFLINTLRKRATVFLISDFIDFNDFEKSMFIAAKKHDLIAIQVFDKREAELPKIGFINAFDSETGQNFWINTSNKKVRDFYSNWWNQHQNKVFDIFKKNNVDFISVRTDQDYVKPLIWLFKNR